VKKIKSTLTDTKPLAFASRPFWSEFSLQYWEKKPVTYTDVAKSAPEDCVVLSLDAAKIFELLVAYCDRCRERDSLAGLKIYRNGVRLESFEAIVHLPVAADKSLEGYHRRMKVEFNEYGLVCDELLQVLSNDDPDRARLQTLVRGLFSFTGIPNRFAEVGLYLGNYRKTPFGVHVDPCGVFSIPVVGRKTFRLWDPNFVEKNPELKEAFSYDEFKKKSIVLEAGVGDITYWPSSHWHIAESDGKFSCTWSIGVWVDRPLSDVVIDTLAPLIRKSMGVKGKRTSLGVRASRGTLGTGVLPAELKAAAKKISKLSAPQIETVLKNWWRDHAGRGGLK
jgi:hypothetical protein